MLDKWYFCLGECGLIITGETSAITASDLGEILKLSCSLFFPYPSCEPTHSWGKWVTPPFYHRLYSVIIKNDFKWATLLHNPFQSANEIKEFTAAWFSCLYILCADLTFNYIFQGQEHLKIASNCNYNLWMAGIILEIIMCSEQKHALHAWD